MAEVSEYGEFVDNKSTIQDDIYQAICEYFQNPMMTKIKDVNNFSMYAVKIYAVLGIEERFVIIFIPKNASKNGDVKALSVLRWVSLQTRTLENNFNLKMHSYIPKKSKILEMFIQLSKKNDESYEYIVDLPLRIVLLTKRPKDKKMDYNQTGNLMTALETYHTVLTMKE